MQRQGKLANKKQKHKKPKWQPRPNPNALLSKDERTGKWQVVVQTPMPKFNCMALEGGGMACIAHAGAIDMFHKYGLIHDVEFVSGASGGAIGALAIALGYNSEECSKLMSEMPMKKFIGPVADYSYLRKAYNLWRSKHYALSDGKAFRAWLRKIVADKLGDENAGFDELEKRVLEDRHKKVGGFKRLYVTATRLDLKTNELEVFCSENNTKLSLADAVYASAAYPCLFAPLEFEGKFYGDGGIIEILPAKLFDSKYFNGQEYYFYDKDAPKNRDSDKNPGAIAIKVDTPEEIDHHQWGIKETAEITSVSQYLWKVVDAALGTTTDHQDLQERIFIAISDLGFPRYNLSLDDEKKKLLKEEGRKTTRNVLMNMFDAAFAVKTYQSKDLQKAIKKWLDGLYDISPVEISALIKAYRVMRDELEDDWQELARRNKEAKEREGLQRADQAVSNDPNRPTAAELTYVINALQEYKALRDEEFECHDGKKDIKLEYPKIFINLKSRHEPRQWNKLIRAELEEELENINLKIDALKVGDEKAKRDLFNVMVDHGVAFDEDVVKAKVDDGIVIEEGAIKASTDDSKGKGEEDEADEDNENLTEEEEQAKIELFHGAFDEAVQTAALYREHLAARYAQKRNLENMLDIDSEDKRPPNAKDSRECKNLCDDLHELLDDPHFPSATTVILDSLPTVVIKEASGYSNIDFTLDMREDIDRKIYLIGAMIYLNYMVSLERKSFKDVYDKYFPEESPEPQSIGDLRVLLKQEGSDLEVSLYRIECLLQYFEKKQYPNKESVLDLDRALGSTKFSFFKDLKKKSKQNEKGEEEIEMVVIISDEKKKARPISHPLMLFSTSSDEESSSEVASGNTLKH